MSARIERVRDSSDFAARMADEVRVGLQAGPLPELPSKYFYDDRGSALFDEITRLPEYYQTRTELGILEAIADEVVEVVQPRELCELGSGIGRKVRLILDAMAQRDLLERCVLLDISEGFLVRVRPHPRRRLPRPRGPGRRRATSSRTSRPSAPEAAAWRCFSPARWGTCTRTTCRPSCRPWRGSSSRGTRSSWAWTW